MKIHLTLALLLVTLGCLALDVPLSDVPVQTDANLLNGLTRVDPEDGAPEKLQTKTWFWQDGGDLVVRFEAEIDSTFTPGSVSLRDEGGSADYLRLQLITMPEAHFAYYYAAYPTGTLEDGVRGSSLSIDLSWNSHYTYETSHNDSLWTVTMRVPLGELRFRQPAPYRWKVILHRYHDESEDFYVLPFLTTNDGKDYFLKAQDIVLTEPLKHTLDIAIKPYFVKGYDLLSRTSTWDPEHVGLDIAFNPGQRTRIKIALNPDYSDAPMDNAQDDYNSKYPPYYDENRFFFTEDIDAFGVDYDVLNTRNIAQPRLAFKATGSSDVVKWGALGAFDKEIRDGTEIVNPDDYFQVLALNPAWRRFQMYNAVVSRVNKGYYNHVYSGSAMWEFYPHLYLASALNLSTLRHEDAGVPDPLNGYRAGLSLKADPGDFDASLGYIRLSKDLAYDAGYLYETDYEYIGGSIAWSKSYAARKIRYLAFNSWFYGYHSQLSVEPYYTYESGFTSNLNLASKFNFMFYGSSARVPDLVRDLHDVYSGTLGCTWAKLREFRIYIGYTYSQSLVYSLADVYSRHTANINSVLKPWESMSLSLTGSWTRYGYPEENLVGGIPVKLDNSYLIANASLEYTPSSTFQITLGSGLSTYERSGSFATLSAYGNLRYEFRPEWFAYLGFKSAQTQDDPSAWDDPLGHFRKDLGTVYAKVSVTL